MLLLDVLAESQYRHDLSAFTLRNYAAGLARWAARGVVHTEEVSPASASRFVEARLKVNAVVSVSADFSALLSVLAHLERTGRYGAAALEAVRRVAPKKPKKRQLCADFLTRDEVSRYCAAAPEGIAFLVWTACYTGLRASELARLQWTDVDLSRRSLHVRSGKTGPRRVSLCGPAVELLAAGQDSGPVFGGASAKALDARVRRARRASGIRVTLTLCRHTRASWWVQGGVPLAVVAAQLGHSVAVCAEFYAGLGDAYNPAVEMGAAG